MVNAFDCRFDEASPVSTGRQLSYDRSTRLRMFAATDKKLETQRTQRFTGEKTQGKTTAKYPRRSWLQAVRETGQARLYTNRESDPEWQFNIGGHSEKKKTPSINHSRA